MYLDCCLTVVSYLPVGAILVIPQLLCVCPLSPSGFPSISSALPAWRVMKSGREWISGTFLGFNPWSGPDVDRSFSFGLQFFHLLVQSGQHFLQDILIQILINHLQRVIVGSVSLVCNINTTCRFACFLSWESALLIIPIKIYITNLLERSLGLGHLIHYKILHPKLIVELVVTWEHVD